jgi:2-keto-3-deoxy-L-rhamnonate aldolase RhmA
MRPNAVKEKLLRDEVAIGPMLLSPDPQVVGVLGAAGFDFVMADLEHTSASLRDLENLVRAADAAGIVPTTRVASSAKADILAVLETGVRAIMVPVVESAEEAHAVVAAARYAPEGRRGIFYLGYSSDYCGTPPLEYFEAANRELLLILQVETARGVENAAEIAAVPGVDCVLVGPGDLSASLGIPWEFDHPRLWEAISHTFRTARLQGKIAGMMPGTPAHARRAYDEGGRLFLWGPDLALLLRAAKEDAAQLAEAVPWGPG